jgi:hypothetical protein
MERSDPRHRTTIRRVGQALSQRDEALASAMVDRIVAEVPAYTRASGELIDQVLALSTATAHALSASMVSGRAVRREDVPMVRDHAALRLRQGIELDAFLHAYRAALFHYWDACAEEAARLQATRDASLALGRFVLDAIDTITTHAAEAYLREDARLRTQTGRLVRDLIDRLIAGQPVTGAVRHPAAPGLDPAGPMQLIVARVVAGEGDLTDALTAVRDTLEESMSRGTARPLCAVRHNEIVLIAAGAPPISRVHTAARRLREERAIDARFGVAPSGAGFAGIPRAYTEGVLTVTYTSRDRPVVELAGLSALALALLGCDAATRTLIVAKGERLRSLPVSERATTHQTIRAFADADLNVTRAASALRVHANTVRYRLSRIAELTGHDPRTFAGLTELCCLMEARAIGAVSDPMEREPAARRGRGAGRPGGARSTRRSR